MQHSENIENLRSYDNDKYLALHFAPKDKREQLAALFNFHYLISQIPVEVSEPMIGMIKFQWWRDVFEEIRIGQPPRPHPVLLGLQHSNVNYDKLEQVIDQYETLLENKLPSFAELDKFIDNTQSIIFQQAANILETSFNEHSAKAYEYNFMARRLSANSAFAKLATNPDVLISNLIAKSQELLSSDHTVFDKITAYYNNKINAKRWILLLKLAFSRAVFL